MLGTDFSTGNPSIRELNLQYFDLISFANDESSWGIRKLHYLTMAFSLWTICAFARTIMFAELDVGALVVWLICMVGYFLLLYAAMIWDKYNFRRIGGAAQEPPDSFRQRQMVFSDLGMFGLIAVGYVLYVLLHPIAWMWQYGSMLFLGYLSPMVLVHRKIRTFWKKFESANRDQMADAVRAFPKYKKTLNEFYSGRKIKVEAHSEQEISHKKQDLDKAVRLRDIVAVTGFILTIISIFITLNKTRIININLSAFLGEFPDNHPILFWILFSAAFIAFLIVGAWIKDKHDSSEKEAELNRLPNIEYVLSVDHRDPFLLLRSFKDDSLKNGGRRFELSLETLKNLGPLIALGSPQDDLPEFGAYRSYVDQDKWQETAIGYMERARMIFVVPTVSQWIDWEMLQIAERGLWYKTALIFPPGLAREEKIMRLDGVRTHIPNLNAVSSNLDITDTVILHFFSRSTVTNILDSRLRRSGYVHYINALAAAIAEEYPALWRRTTPAQ
jgi:hypothetical protein